MFQDENKEPEDQWTDILSTDQIDLAQNQLKPEMNVPPNVQLEEPLNYYKLFVIEEVIEKMVAETNEPAAELYVHML